LTSYLFKVNIGRTVIQLEDRRTDGRNTFSSLKSYDETRWHRKISVICSADVELQTDDCQPCTFIFSSFIFVPVSLCHCCWLFGLKSVLRDMWPKIGNIKCVVVFLYDT